MILQRVLNGAGRDADIDLLLDVSDNISVGLGWPPKQTTICPLGPSAVSPVMSLVRHFREEVEAHIAGAPHSGGQGVAVSIRGIA
jgi:NADH-quinone oxidoreductase subunit F